MDRLRVMESFVTVVRCGSFSAAARRLGLPRSVVSKHISLLETHLGARLFSRTTLASASRELDVLCRRMNGNWRCGARMRN